MAMQLELLLGRYLGGAGFDSQPQMSSPKVFTQCYSTPPRKWREKI